MDHAQGVADILLRPLLGTEGWRLHTAALHSFPATQALVRKAGGELLEKAGQPRSMFSGPQYVDAVQKTPIARARQAGRFSASARNVSTPHPQLTMP